MGELPLTIDERTVAARPGETVLQCALRHEIAIPHLCSHPGLEPFGACRMCLVEIEGVRGFPASCSTPAQEGMKVRTDTPELRELRRHILELIMLEHPSACLVCDKRELCQKYRPKADKAGCATGCHTCSNKEVCDIRRLAEELHLRELPVPPFYRGLPVERSDPFIDRDMNLCILCGRCVRVCRKQHGTGVIDFVARGSRTVVSPAFGRPLLEAGCRFCGSCVDACPTGSLADRYAKWHGRPDAAVRTTCGLCPAACPVEVSAEAGRCVQAVALDEDLPICVLGRFATAAFLNGPDRLDRPTVMIGGARRRVEWDQALSLAAERLPALVGPAFALVCSPTSTLEDRRIFRQFASQVMRSENLLELEADARGTARAALPDTVRAAILTGDFVPAERLRSLDLLVVLDVYPTKASDRAEVVLPAAVLAEIDGTLLDDAGSPRPLVKACRPPGEARPDWRIVADLARAMGAPGFDYARVEDVTGQLDLPEIAIRMGAGEAPAAARDPRKRRTHYRGHRVDEHVPGLNLLPLDDNA